MQTSFLPSRPIVTMATIRGMCKDASNICNGLCAHLKTITFVYKRGYDLRRSPRGPPYQLQPLQHGFSRTISYAQATVRAQSLMLVIETSTSVALFVLSSSFQEILYQYKAESISG